MAVKSAKKSIKKSAKKTPKRSRNKAASLDVRKEVLDWIKANPSGDVAKAALRDFGAGFERLKKWLKRERVQVKDALESLVQFEREKALLKGKGTREELAAAIKRKKAELKGLASRLKTAARPA